jgi:hypothetical protein
VIGCPNRQKGSLRQALAMNRMWMANRCRCLGRSRQVDQERETVLGLRGGIVELSRIEMKGVEIRKICVDRVDICGECRYL